ncbi:MAG: hypothetical protein DLM59_17345 [Pseudonocardiales bacterium]|nr:MAG: hypothetical protein DLM59_17345 [Pseudonocardiales bacterium]
MGRHADGRRAGPPALPPRSLLIALAAAAAVLAVVLGAVALSGHHRARPARPVTDLRPSPAPLLSPSARPTSTAGN